MSGQVDEGSIVGNNRAKTKIYWEEQMRNEEKARNRGSKYGVNNAPSSDLIIQKMNAEIEELHRREKELKQKQKTEVEDEEDVFSSNTSSVDEFEHSDSPRLESGFYSNAGEDESIPSPELAIETSTNDESRSQTESPLTVEVDILTVTTPETQRSEGFVTRAAVSPVQPLDEPESPPPVFTFQKETPIEREIRLARERDNEYMLRRLSSSTSNLNGSGSDFHSLPSTPVTVATKPKPTPRAFSTSAAVIEEKAEEDVTVNVTPVVVKGKPFNSRDIQYQMATERLKREIQEAKEREEELKSRELNNVPKTPVATKTYVPDYVSVEPVKAVATRFQGVEKRKSYTFSATVSVDESEKSAAEKSSPQERKNSIKEATPVVEVRRFSGLANGVTADIPSSPTVATVEVSETKPEVSFNPIARPKFNSIERYLLKSSVKLRIGKNFQIPTAASVFEPETPATPTEKNAEAYEEEQEPVTPRRKLIRAQDKIDQELREMREREKEFALRRAFKSTPDLSQESKDEENNNNIVNANVEAQPQPIIIRNKEGTPEIKERRRSALINQWEEKIQTAN